MASRMVGGVCCWPTPQCVCSLTSRGGLSSADLCFCRGPADRAVRGALDGRPGSGRMSGGVDGDMWQRGRPLPPGRSGGMGPGMRGAAVANLPALHKTESAFKVWLVNCWCCWVWCDSFMVLIEDAMGNVGQLCFRNDLFHFRVMFASSEEVHVYQMTPVMADVLHNG